MTGSPVKLQVVDVGLPESWKRENKCLWLGLQGRSIGVSRELKGWRCGDGCDEGVGPYRCGVSVSVVDV